LDPVNPGSPAPQLPQRCPSTVMAEDEVVEESNADEVADLGHASCEAKVFCAW